MKLKTLLSVLFACAITLAYAQESPQLFPSPRQVHATGETYPLPPACALAGASEADSAAVRALKEVLPCRPVSPKEAPYTIYIGEKGDKSVKKYARLIPAQPEGYYLSVTGREIVLAGADARGTYYAVKTLAQLLKSDRLPGVEITDYPDIRFRGVVEGFYGQPWSFADRVSQFRFYGDAKLNTYIYGPKDDPYHSSPHWRLPYPEKEAARLGELVRIARANHVDFVWAVHPGQDIRWNDADRQQLLAKFEAMYRLGVRSFAVFFDDISGEGTDPLRQAELLNFLDDRFVKAKPDVTPLIMCPTEYNKSWSDPEKGYLVTLGEKLNPSVQVMWTGDRVISDITRQGLDWINPRIRRPAYIWWNFPVSDYVRDHLLLGPVYGIETDIAPGAMSGFVANPMEHAEASKIAVYGVAAYAWNMQAYDSLQAWNGALRYLMPGDADALRTFAAHNADPGPNGHGYRRDESTEIRAEAARFAEAYKKGEKPDGARMLREFEAITEAADRLLVNKENPALVKEITPWLYQFRLLGETGREVLAMAAAGSREEFLRKYNHVRALKELSFRVDRAYNQNPYQPGVKTATRVLQPFVNEVLVTAVTRYNAEYGDTLRVETDYCPHRLVSDVPQLQYQPLQMKNNRVLVSPLLEVVKWQPGQQVEIRLDRPYPLSAIELNLGAADVTEWGTLQISAGDGVWRSVPLTVKGTFYKAAPEQSAVRSVRFTHTGSAEKQVYLRQFGVTLAEE